MSENYNPKDGTPDPYVNRQPAPQPPIYLDPKNKQDNSDPGLVYTGHPGGGKSAYLYPQYAQGRNYGAVSRKEANTKATIALILGILSFFTVGPVISIPGYFLAKQAELANGENAKIARIVNMISIGASIAGGFLILLVIAVAGSSHLQ